MCVLQLQLAAARSDVLDSVLHSAHGQWRSAQQQLPPVGCGASRPDALGAVLCSAVLPGVPAIGLTIGCSARPR